MPPRQKPGKSEQNVATPWELIEAVKRDFCVRMVAWDLAATAENSKADEPRYFLGPGSAFGEDALSGEWPFDGDCWLNPPFSDIEPWAKKCSEQKRRGRIFLLTPASTGADWFQRYVLNRAQVVAVAPRVTFEGHTSPYPKDLVISVFSSVVGGVSTWRWKP